MGKISRPVPVKLFVGLLTSVPEHLSVVEEELTRLFGIIELRSGPFLFDFTDYYDEEMGTPIHRSFVAFRELRAPEDIAHIKVQTNGLELLFAGMFPRFRRPVNLDPGYLELSKIVLASTKNFYHRILLARGIYGEITLRFQAGAWKPFPWTFPDFKSGRYEEFFKDLRSLYAAQLKHGSGSPDH